MQRRRLGPELQHVADDRRCDAGTAAARHRAEHGERRAHGSRIGVVALVDQQRRATGDGKLGTRTPPG